MLFSFSVFAFLLKFLFWVFDVESENYNPRQSLWDNYISVNYHSPPQGSEKIVHTKRDSANTEAQLWYYGKLQYIYWKSNGKEMLQLSQKFIQSSWYMSDREHLCAIDLYGVLKYCLFGIQFSPLLLKEAGPKRISLLAASWKYSAKQRRKDRTRFMICHTVFLSSAPLQRHSLLKK